jgi:hypothetical protein
LNTQGLSADFSENWIHELREFVHPDPEARELRMQCADDAPD